jgi:2-methylcitrate dehydratase PrpD
MAKSFHSGLAAKNGLLAAELASLNYTSSESALSGKRGFLSVMADESYPAVLTEELGKTHELLVRHSVKPYPCGVVLHPILDAACALRRRLNNFEPSEVESIIATVNPYVLELTAKEDPRVGLEGKFSIYYTVSVALLRGQVRVDDFTDRQVRDESIRSLMKTIQANPDEDMPVSHAKIVINFKNGNQEEQSIEGSRGMPETPMTDAEIKAKFNELVEPVLGMPNTENLTRSIKHLEHINAFTDVMALLVFPK